MNQEGAEQVTLRVISNDGDTAVCVATVNGNVVDEVQFVREKDSREVFLSNLKVGTAQAGVRKVTDDNGFEDAKQLASVHRQEVNVKPRKCRGRNNG